NTELERTRDLLKEIKGLWDELPNEGEVDDFGKAVGEIAQNLAAAKESWDELPSGVDLEQLGECAQAIARPLAEAQSISNVPVETMSTEDLRAEWRRLERRLKPLFVARRPRRKKRA